MGALIEAGDHRRGGGNGWPQHSGAWGRRNMHWMDGASGSEAYLPLIWAGLRRAVEQC
ncbi:hypothetical protein [Sphingobium sp. TomTYG75]